MRDQAPETYMQASPAKNETRLPRAVLKISDAVKAGIDARAALKTQEHPAAGAQPPTADIVDPNTPAAPAPPPADPRENDIDHWRHLAKSYAGRLRVAGEERRAEADEFRRQITELQGQVRSLQAAAPSAEVDMTGLLSPEQIDVLGEEEAKAVAKAAMTAAQRYVKEAIDAEIKPLKDAAETKAKRDAEDRKAKFLDKLTELVPNYAEIDTAETGFHEWLAENDMERQTLLDLYVRTGNAAKVASVFKEFIKSKQRPAPPVAPNGTGATGAADTQPQHPTGDAGYPSKGEIQSFYKRASTVRKGQPGYVTDEERAKFEARLKLRAPR